MSTWSDNMAVIQSMRNAGRPQSDTYYLGTLMEAAAEKRRREQEDRDYILQKRQYELEGMKNKLDAEREARENSRFNLSLQPYKPSSNFNMETGETDTAFSVPIGQNIGAAASASGLGVTDELMKTAFRIGNLTPGSNTSNGLTINDEAQRAEEGIENTLLPYEPTYKYSKGSEALYKLRENLNQKDTANQRTNDTRIIVTDKNNATKQSIAQGNNDTRLVITDKNNAQKDTSNKRNNETKITVTDMNNKSRESIAKNNNDTRIILSLARGDGRLIKDKNGKFIYMPGEGKKSLSSSKFDGTKSLAYEKYLNKFIELYKHNWADEKNVELDDSKLMQKTANQLREIKNLYNKDFETAVIEDAPNLEEFLKGHVDLLDLVKNALIEPDSPEAQNLKENNGKGRVLFTADDWGVK